MMETLTKDLHDAALEIIREVEEMGGMTKAVVSGMPKARIEEAAARRQARIDSGAETIIGVNKHRLAKEAAYESLKVDNTEVRKKQIERIKATKAKRDNAKCQAALLNLTLAASSGKQNLLELAVIAAQERATLGEISLALESIFGRYTAQDSIVRGAYSSETTNAGMAAGMKAYEQALEKVKAFSAKEGRNPRILVAKMGQDGHDRGAKVIASGFADIGFDVDVGGLF